MSDHLKLNGAVAEYLQSVVRLEALEKITKDLDQELADSQRIMGEIKSMFDSIPNQNTVVSTGKVWGHEDQSNFMDAGVPKLLLKDMVQDTVDVNLDDVITAMKKYAEDLKKNFVQAQPQFNNRVVTKPELESLNIEEYALSLDLLSKRLANIKLNKNDVDNRNMELETKLAQLCEDVNVFTQMVQAKTTLSECNQNSSSAPLDTAALHYDNIINRMLSAINEVTYLLRNKN